MCGKGGVGFDGYEQNQRGWVFMSGEGLTVTALLGKLPVDVGIVRLGIGNESMLFCKVVQHLVKFFIGNIIKQP